MSQIFRLLETYSMFCTHASSDVLDVVKNVLINLFLQLLLQFEAIAWISNIQMQVSITNMTIPQHLDAVFLSLSQLH